MNSTLKSIVFVLGIFLSGNAIASGCSVPRMDGNIARYGQKYGTLVSDGYGSSASFYWCADQGNLPVMVTTNGINYVPHICDDLPISVTLNASAEVPPFENVPPNYTKGWTLNCPKYRPLY